MSTPRVLVITKDSLLGLTLPNLIDASGRNFDVIESSAHEFDELIEEINSTRANVILLEQNSLFAEGDLLAKLLKSYPKFLVIVTNQEDNWLRTYRRQDVLLTSSADLVSVISSARKDSSP